jgi:isopropylmalate/homocitrate/citramalate synthase
MKAVENKAQSERFRQAARELGVELDEEKLKEALRKIAPEDKTRKEMDRDGR